MPKQNRVTPFGDIVAIPDRGTMMGNRGVLHDELGRILRPWQLKRWLICRLEFRGRRRIVMAPNRYTELFFLDEATALAVGHRPCAECRRASYLAYWDAHCRSSVGDLGHVKHRRVAESLDNQLHDERLDTEGGKRTFDATIAELPNGVFVSIDRADAHLIWNRRLLAWSPSGYTLGPSTPPRTLVKVLTPGLSVNAIRGGYVPEVHPSVE